MKERSRIFKETAGTLLDIVATLPCVCSPNPSLTPAHLHAPAQCRPVLAEHLVEAVLLKCGCVYNHLGHLNSTVGGLSFCIFNTGDADVAGLATPL